MTTIYVYDLFIIYNLLVNSNKCDDIFNKIACYIQIKEWMSTIKLPSVFTGFLFLLYLFFNDN